MSIPGAENPLDRDPLVELHRVFDIVEAVQDPDAVPNLVMPLVYLHLRSDMLVSQKETMTLLHERGWTILRAAGFAEVVEDDSRRDTLGSDDLPDAWYDLNPRALFTTIGTIHARLEAEDITDRENLREQALTHYDIVASRAGIEAADFLADIAGARITEDRTIELRTHMPKEELAAVRQVFAVLSPWFRDFARMNIDAMRIIDPAIADAVEGTQVQDPQLAAAWEAYQRLRKRHDDNN